MAYETIKGLQGATLVSATAHNDLMQFKTIDGDLWEFYHQQDCCESVGIEDVNGDLNDLLGEPLEVAEVTESEERPEGVETENYDDLNCWTFYRFRTVKGTVVVRWHGSSNGYYSVAVSIYKNGERVYG